MKRYVLGFGVTLLVIGMGGFVGSGLFSEPGAILAKVGEKAITQADLHDLVKRYEAATKGPSLTLEEKRNLLDKLIRHLLISIEAEKEDLDKGPELQRKLRLYRNELLVNEYVETRVAPLVTVKEEEVEEIMKRNPNLISRETLTLREILVKTEQEARVIHEELKKGADFSRMATERSISQTRAKGGLLGSISSGQVPSPFAEALAGLKEGEFSQPIKTDDGFRMFYLVSRKEISPEQFEALSAKVREKVIQLEKQKRVEALVDKKVEELKRQIKVDIYFDRLK